MAHWSRNCQATLVSRSVTCPNRSSGDGAWMGSLTYLGGRESKTVQRSRGHAHPCLVGIVCSVRFRQIWWLVNDKESRHMLRASGECEARQASATGRYQINQAYDGLSVSCSARGTYKCRVIKGKHRRGERVRIYVWARSWSKQYLSWRSFRKSSKRQPVHGSSQNSSRNVAGMICSRDRKICYHKWPMKLSARTKRASRSHSIRKGFEVSH